MQKSVNCVAVLATMIRGCWYLGEEGIKDRLLSKIRK